MSAVNGTRASLTPSKGGETTKDSGTQASPNASTDTKSVSANLRSLENVSPFCEDCPRTSCERCPVKTNPAKYRQLEKTEKRKVRAWIVGVFVGVILVGAAAWFGYEQYTTSQRVEQIVASHDSELAQTKAIVIDLRNDIKSHQGDAAATSRAAAAIESYAQQLEASSAANHSQTLAILQNICASTPGCHIP
jgi:cell division protein FtsB